MTNRPSAGAVVIGIVALSAVMGGCDKHPTPAPTTPSVVPPPIVLAISPNVGSTDGDTRIEISGTGFSAAAIATVDGTAVNVFRNPAGTLLVSHTPAHAASVVDVVVRNPDGQVGILPAAYTFAPPDSFDFIGNWLAYLMNGNDFPFGFTIQNGGLTSVTCDDGTTVAFPTAVPVVNGQVWASGSAGVIFSAKFVAADRAIGTINIATCVSSRWEGWKDNQAGAAGPGAHRRGK